MTAMGSMGIKEPVAQRTLRIPNAVPQRLVPEGTCGRLVVIHDDPAKGTTVGVRWPGTRRIVYYSGAGLSLIGWEA